MEKQKINSTGWTQYRILIDGIILTVKYQSIVINGKTSGKRDIPLCGQGVKERWGRLNGYNPRVHVKIVHGVVSQTEFTLYIHRGGSRDT